MKRIAFEIIDKNGNILYYVNVPDPSMEESRKEQARLLAKGTPGAKVKRRVYKVKRPG